MGIVGLVALMCVSLVLLARDKSSSVTAPSAQTTLELTDNGDAGSQTFQVPASRVPRTVAQAEQAPAIALNPSRWSQDPENTGGTDVSTALSAADRSDVAEAAERFWRAWERWPSFKTPGDVRQYESALRPLTTASGFGSVSSRSDNHQPSFICPQVTCVGGSTPVTYDGYGTPADSVEIRDYDAEAGTVYLVMYGVVRYSGKQQPLAGKAYNRSYGIVMYLQDGAWLVQRASADTTGPAEE